LCLDFPREGESMLERRQKRDYYAPGKKRERRRRNEGADGRKLYRGE